MLSKAVMRCLIDKQIDSIHDSIDLDEERTMYENLGLQRVYRDSLDIIAPDMSKGELLHRLNVIKHEYKDAYFDCTFDSSRRFYYNSAYNYMDELTKQLKELL